MCGIGGVFRFQNRGSKQLRNLIGMTNAMQHRGPDDEGYLLVQEDKTVRQVFGKDTPELVRSQYRELQPSNAVMDIKSVVALGHRRLSILDLSSAGHQPMSYDNGRYWIIYNGEIYNYLELREHLVNAGHSFVSQCDTEVILAAYKEWGTECQQKFNGDWAFIIYDMHLNEVFVSRDRFGVKPLYYYQDDEQLIFASEIKGLIAHPVVHTGPNLDYLKSYLVSGAKEWKKKTAFLGINRFPFAHCARIKLSNAGYEWTPVRYWQMVSTDSKETFCLPKAKEYAKTYYELLKDAVRLRLRSDVPIGSALSGGLDSSSIVFLIDELHKEYGLPGTQRTYSIVHTSPETRHCDESYYIGLLAKQLKLDSYTTEPNTSDIPGLVTDVAKYWENPPNSLSMSGMFTTKLAKEIGCVVTLDGQGADEQQAGYEYYIYNYLVDLDISECIRESIALTRNFGIRSQSTKMIVQALIAKLLGKKIARMLKAMWLGSRADSIDSLDYSLNETLQLSFSENLVNLIHYADSRSMMFSIESRMPFLDYRLVEFMAKIPAAYKVHNGFTKYFARMAFSGKLPNEIVWRKDKMGWPMPEEYWKNATIGQQLWDMVEKCPLLKKIDGVSNSRDIDTTSFMTRVNVAAFRRTFFPKY